MYREEKKRESSDSEMQRRRPRQSASSGSLLHCARVPGVRAKAIRSDINEWGREERRKENTAGNRVSRNVYTGARVWTETEGGTSWETDRAKETRKQKRRKSKRPLIRPEWGEMQGLRRQQRRWGRTEKKCGMWWHRHGSRHMKGLQEATSSHPSPLKPSADMN